MYYTVYVHCIVGTHTLNFLLFAFVATLGRRTKTTTGCNREATTSLFCLRQQHVCTYAYPWGNATLAPRRESRVISIGGRGPPNSVHCLCILLSLSDPPELCVRYPASLSWILIKCPWLTWMLLWVTLCRLLTSLGQTSVRFVRPSVRRSVGRSLLHPHTWPRRKRGGREISSSYRPHVRCPAARGCRRHRRRRRRSGQQQV